MARRVIPIQEKTSENVSFRTIDSGKSNCVIGQIITYIGGHGGIAGIHPPSGAIYPSGSGNVQYYGCPSFDDVLQAALDAWNTAKKAWKLLTADDPITKAKQLFFDSKDKRDTDKKIRSILDNESDALRNAAENNDTANFAKWYFNYWPNFFENHPAPDIEIDMDLDQALRDARDAQIPIAYHNTESLNDINTFWTGFGQKVDNFLQNNPFSYWTKRDSK